MSDSGRLVGFGLVLAVALGVGFGVGSAVGPVELGRQPGVVGELGSTVPGGHGAMETEADR